MGLISEFKEFLFEYKVKPLAIAFIMVLQVQHL
jgi:large-conductance mechanosensitive channel